jgi:ABC-type lipoprotein release transport system permease subunit
MPNIQEILRSYSLNPNNSIVIGSGILNALGIRKSNDIDITVKQKTYVRLSELPEFEIKNNSEAEMLTTDILEISTNLPTPKHTYSFKELFDNSIVIDHVRYLKLEFLLIIKKQWNRDKDKKDIRLIEKYIQSH